MLEELLKNLQELNPGKGLFKVGDSEVSYNITDNGYSISVITTKNLDSLKIKAKDNKQEIEDAAKKAAEAKRLELLKKVNEYVRQFRSDMEKIDDSIFSDACDLFNQVSKYNINELAKILDDADNFHEIKLGTNNFKTIVNAVLNKEIDRLKSQFLALENID